MDVTPPKRKIFSGCRSHRYINCACAQHVLCLLTPHTRFYIFFVQMTSVNHNVPSTPANWTQRLHGQVGFIRDRVQKLDRDGDPQDNVILTQSYLQRLSDAVRVAVRIFKSSAYEKKNLTSDISSVNVLHESRGDGARQNHSIRPQPGSRSI